jgi:hypothetical protein
VNSLQTLVNETSHLPVLGDKIKTILKDLIKAPDPVLLCLYNYEHTGGTAEQPNVYYSLDLTVLTTQHLMQVALMTQTHFISKKQIKSIDRFSLETPAVGDNLPKWATLSVWIDQEPLKIEATQQHYVKQLLEASRVISKLIGKDLTGGL